MSRSLPFRPAPGVSALSGQPRVARELLPCTIVPPPSVGGGFVGAAFLIAVSRAVRSRVRKRAAISEWAESGVETLNELYIKPQPEGGSAALSAGQASALESIHGVYAPVRPPSCTDSAAAFTALCGNRPGYGPVSSKAVPLRKGSQISLPPTGLEFVNGGDPLSSEDRTAWVGCWKRRPVCGPL